MTKEEKRGIIRRLIISVLFVILLCIAIYALLYLLGLTGLTQEKVQALVRDFGAFAVLAFIAISFLQVTFIPIPSTVTVVAGAYLFGALPSFFYSYIGICLGSLVAYELGRGLGRPFAKWVAGSEDVLDGWIARLRGRERILLWVLFFAPFFPDDTLAAVAGLLKIRRIEFLLMQLLSRISSIGGTLIIYSFFS